MALDIKESLVAEIWHGADSVIASCESATKAEKVYGLIESLVRVIDVEDGHDCEFVREALLECINNLLSFNHSAHRTIANHVLNQETSWPLQ